VRRKKKNKEQIRCDCCGQYIDVLSAFTSDFIPDNLFGPEAEVFHCENCTKKEGPAEAHFTQTKW
jgi:uncharacterized protein with PIN domain